MIKIDVVSDDAVFDVIAKAGRPVPTLEVAELLANTHRVPLEDVSVTRMRRSLDRLEYVGRLVASGGPKRPDLPGWSIGDKRDVLWATQKVALQIAEEYAAAEQERVAAIERRIYLLKQLHKHCTFEQREALGITGLHLILKDDPTSTRDHGATTWEIDVLETVCELAGIE